MNITIPGLAETLAMVKDLPDNFETLINRMDRLIELVEETNDILRRQ